jgi:cytoskeleton protein RodZ
MEVGFGKELREQREARGVELETIATNTKVSIQHLRALEAENRSDLPGGIFNKGIVRNYCRCVGLEENEWLERFAASGMAEANEPDWAAFADSVRRNRLHRGSGRQRGWWGVLLMALGLAGMAWGVWHFAIGPRMRQQHRSANAQSAHAVVAKAPASPSSGRRGSFGRF